MSRVAVALAAMFPLDEGGAGASGALDPDAYAERGSFWLGVLDSLGGSTRRW